MKKKKPRTITFTEAQANEIEKRINLTIDAGKVLQVPGVKKAVNGLIKKLPDSPQKELLKQPVIQKVVLGALFRAFGLTEIQIDVVKEPGTDKDTNAPTH